MNSTVKGPSVAEPEVWETGCPAAHTQKEDCGPKGPEESMDSRDEGQLSFAIRSYEVANPASRAGLLLAQTNAVSAQVRLNAVTIYAIENDARALLSADPSGANAVLGALSALRGRVEDVRVHYRIALEAAEPCPATHLNYSIALMQVGDSVGAYRMAREADEHARERDAVLPHLIMCAFESGHFRETLEHCERWHDLQPETHFSQCGAAQSIMDAIERGTLSEQAAANALRTANHMRGTASVRPAAGALYQDVRHPGEFRYRIDVHTTREHAHDLSVRVAARLAESARSTGEAGNTLRIVFVATW